jgi:hypothetical protein
MLAVRAAVAGADFAWGYNNFMEGGVLMAQIIFKLVRFGQLLRMRGAVGFC